MKLYVLLLTLFFSALAQAKVDRTELQRLWIVDIGSELPLIQAVPSANSRQFALYCLRVGKVHGLSLLFKRKILEWSDENRVSIPESYLSYQAAINLLETDCRGGTTAHFEAQRAAVIAEVQSLHQTVRSELRAH